MLDPEAVESSYLDAVKRHLKVTWEDEVTDTEIWEKMCRAEYALNDKLGAEIDYFSAPSREQGVYMAYMLYAWNNCESDFDAAYGNDILQIRAKYAVSAAEGGADEEEV